MDRYPLLNSLRIAAISCVLVFFTGIFFAYYAAKLPRVIKGILDVFLCMGNSDVPVGQYTQKILAFYGLNEEELAKAGKITYGTNVKEVTTQVKDSGVVDSGVVYGTDAFSAGLEVIDTATKDMCGQVIYPAAVMKNSAHADAAQTFLDYLKGDEAMAVFEGVGFSRA